MMETRFSGAAHPVPGRRLPVAAVVALVTVLGLGVSLILANSLDTNAWAPGGLLVIGFLLCPAGGTEITPTRR